MDAPENAGLPPGPLARWLSPNGYLGLHLVVGFAVALLAGIAFGLVALEVFEDDATPSLDARAHAIAQQINSPLLTRVMLAATFVGNTSTITVLTVAVIIALAQARSHRRMVAFLAAMIGGSLLNILLKSFFQRPRPTAFEHLAPASGFSFPSGHSMGSMLFFGGLAYVVYFTFDSHHPAKRLAAVAVCLLAACTIGLSRIYLGVHYLSDVVAGFSAAIFWIGVCVSATEGWIRWRDWRASRRRVEA